LKSIVHIPDSKNNEEVNRWNDEFSCLLEDEMNLNALLDYYNQKSTVIGDFIKIMVNIFFNTTIYI
jgi:hypothetical protein